MARAAAGVQSELDVESSPAVSNGGMQIAHWSWIWFGIAVLVVIGFHIRMFGHPVPPSAHFP